MAGGGGQGAASPCAKRSPLHPPLYKGARRSPTDRHTTGTQLAATRACAMHALDWHCARASNADAFEMKADARSRSRPWRMGGRRER